MAELELPRIEKLSLPLARLGNLYFNTGCLNMLFFSAELSVQFTTNMPEPAWEYAFKDTNIFREQRLPGQCKYLFYLWSNWQIEE